MGIRIGPCRIADADGTHEPGDVLDNPSQALIDLAQSKELDPETGLAYCEVLSPARTATAVAAIAASAPAIPAAAPVAPPEAP